MLLHSPPPHILTFLVTGDAVHRLLLIALLAHAAAHHVLVPVTALPVHTQTVLNIMK